MLFLVYKYNKIDTIAVSFIFFVRNLILFTFSVLQSIGSN